MLSMYLLGIVVALLMAWLFKKTLLKGETPCSSWNCRPTNAPCSRIVLRHMWDRSKLFLRRAGTVILGINILLWFLATYPRSADIEKQYAANAQSMASSTERDAEAAKPSKPNSLRSTRRKPAKNCATVSPDAWGD